MAGMGAREEEGASESGGFCEANTQQQGWVGCTPRPHIHEHGSLAFANRDSGAERRRCTVEKAWHAILFPLHQINMEAPLYPFPAALLPVQLPRRLSSALHIHHGGG